MTEGLERFVQAQDSGGTYDRALAELRAGRKTSHWMWFVFPQLRGLGQSSMAHRYGIADLAEARAYLAHPVLGPRLAECVAAISALPGGDPVAVLGGIDALKLRSSMTLFEMAAGEGGEAAPFAAVLERWYAGERDERTSDPLGLHSQRVCRRIESCTTSWVGSAPPDGPSRCL